VFKSKVYDYDDLCSKTIVMNAKLGANLYNYLESMKIS